MSTTHVTHAAAVAHVVTDSGSTTAVPALDVNLSTRAADATLSGMSAKLPASLGVKAGAESLSVALSTEDAAKVPALVTGRVPVDGSGVTQPVSDAGGSLTVDGAVSITGTATVSGAVTANIGTTNGLALESGGNLASIKLAADSLVAAIAFPDPSFEISRTGLWRTKAALCINIMGRRASFTANVMNDLVMFTPSAGSSTTINEMAGTEALEVVSSSASDTAAGTGARTVKITYIDALNVVGAQVTTTHTLNGTTAVSLGAVRALAIQWAEVATVGSGGVAAGDITIRATVTPTNLYELISAGGDRSMSGRYMVPVGMSAYANEWQGSAVNHDMDIRLRGTVEMGTRASVSPYLFQDAMYPPTGSVSPSRALPWLKFPAGSKLKLSAMPTAVAGSPRCEGSISLVVITN